MWMCKRRLDYFIPNLQILQGTRVNNRVVSWSEINQGSQDEGKQTSAVEKSTKANKN